MSRSTAIAKKRIVTNVMDPRVAVEFDDDGFAHRVVSWVRLFADTDLYSAKQPHYEVWGPGVAKIIAALGARVTPLHVSPDPETQTMRPGKRIIRDEESGVTRRVEQDVLLEARHPMTGSPLYVMATGEVDVYHALMNGLAKLAGERDDVAIMIPSAARKAISQEDEYKRWAWYPYQLGVWIGVNLQKAAVREELAKHREMARSDKTGGFAASKAARLALKRANVVPMRFNSNSMIKDEGKRLYVDIAITSWVVYDSRAKMQAAIESMLERNADAIDAQWIQNGESEDPFDPEQEALYSPPAITENKIPQQDLSEARVTGDPVPVAAAPKAEKPAREEPLPERPSVPSQGAPSAREIRRAEMLENLLEDEQGVSAVRNGRSQFGIDSVHNHTGSLAPYIEWLESIGDEE